MTDLKRLRVSLTKHGAHKVYRLIKHFPAPAVLKNTWDQYADIKIDRAQAARNLSALPDDNLPAIWTEAKNRSTQTLQRLVFLGILFSHHQLIGAFATGRRANGRGRIVLGKVLKGKAFTNTKNDLEELGLATGSSSKFVDYNLGAITSDPQLADLAASLFHLKLSQAQWDGFLPLVEECIRLGFHNALAISASEFRAWLAGASSIVPEEDELPEVRDTDEDPVDPFRFSAGHKRRKTGSARTARLKGNVSARLLHNELQTALFDILVSKHGADNVGTELGSGSSGTSVDLVVKDGDHFDFYEIKTSASVKKCFRQAIAQLLEYAYWPDHTRARHLIVVSQATATKDAKRYLRLLRKSLKIPIYYRTLDIKKGKLSTWA
jgi:hypothetical protein